MFIGGGSMLGEIRYSKKSWEYLGPAAMKSFSLYKYRISY